MRAARSPGSRVRAASRRPAPTISGDPALVGADSSAPASGRAAAGSPTRKRHTGERPISCRNNARREDSNLELQREHERVYGYYVLPLLRRDRIVGRADLKHDRAEGVLRVKAFHPEPGVRGDLDSTLDLALIRLARVLGAQTVSR